MIAELVSCLDRTVAFMLDQVADLTDEDMVLQPPGIPNHASWTLGHVIHSCEAVAVELGVNTWLPEDWGSRFGYGSSPAPCVSQDSGKTALSASLKDAGERLRNALLGIGESGLADPLPDEPSREVFDSKGHALVQIVAAHTAFHAGQLAMWRRAIGRKPAGVFI